MSEVDSLIRAKEEALSVPFMNFNHLISTEGTSGIYYFVEGYDAPYYHPRIKMHSDNKAIPIICYGKKNVIGLNLFLERDIFAKYKKLFFIDRDFDNNEQVSPQIYVTPCYSIENFYVNCECLENILMCQFHIMPQTEAFSKILNLFCEEIHQFHEVVLEFNAWYACFKQKRSSEKVHLDEKFPPNFITLAINGIKKNYDLTQIMQLFNVNTNISVSEIKAMSDIFMSNPFCFLRGKYQIQFFCIFLSFIIEDANNPDKRNFIKKKTSFQINKSLILTLLSQYAATPHSLEDYVCKSLNS